MPSWPKLWNRPTEYMTSTSYHERLSSDISLLKISNFFSQFIVDAFQCILTGVVNFAAKYSEYLGRVLYRGLANYAAFLNAPLFFKLLGKTANLV